VARYSHRTEKFGFRSDFMALSAASSRVGRGRAIFSRQMGLFSDLEQGQERLNDRLVA
jgi:hypothetical protein